jgi:saccharopine dehydrogenase (NAD+, L-lysine-forming)
MKILIVGAGAQGGPCAAILARDRDVSEVVLADIDIDLANKVKAKIQSGKITPMRVDAARFEDLKSAAEDAAVIINLTLTEFNQNIMKVALESKAHYVDTSFGEPVLLDILARDNILSQIIENRPLVFDNEFKDAGLTALVGCGGSPGMVNVFARYLCDKLDRVQEIRIKCGARTLQEAEETVMGWKPTWSPFRALWGYAVEPAVFEDGEYKRLPLFAGCEEYDFSDPVGRVLISHHQHQEQITLPYFIGKGIRHCEFKYPVDILAGAFVMMGFAKPEAIDVKGVKVIPRDVLLKLVPQPVNEFLTENKESAGRPLEAFEVMLIEVKGTKTGEDLTYTITCPFRFFWNAEERLEIYQKLGATGIDVALPAVVGAKMCVEGETEKGVIAAECLDPVLFLKRMARAGVPVSFREECSKDIRLS